MLVKLDNNVWVIELLLGAVLFLRIKLAYTAIPLLAFEGPSHAVKLFVLLEIDVSLSERLREVGVSPRVVL